MKDPQSTYGSILEKSWDKNYKYPSKIIQDIIF